METYELLNEIAEFLNLEEGDEETFDIKISKKGNVTITDICDDKLKLENNALPLLQHFFQTTISNGDCLQFHYKMWDYINVNRKFAERSSKIEALLA